MGFRKSQRSVRLKNAGWKIIEAGTWCSLAAKQTGAALFRIPIHVACQKQRDIVALGQYKRAQKIQRLAGVEVVHVATFGNGIKLGESVFRERSAFSPQNRRQCVANLDQQKRQPDN